MRAFLLLLILAVLVWTGREALRGEGLRDTVRQVRAVAGWSAPDEQWSEATAALLEDAPPRVRDLVFQRDSTLVRWAAGAELRVWIERADGRPGWSADLPERVRKGILAWEAARLPVRVSFADREEDANVIYRWAHQLDGETLGLTELMMNEVLGVQSAVVTIALHDADGTPLDHTKMDATLLHEAGHLFGLVHTDDAMSALHPRSRSTRPSVSDIETVQMLYRLPMGRIPSR